LEIVKNFYYNKRGKMAYNISSIAEPAKRVAERPASKARFNVSVKLTPSRESVNKLVFRFTQTGILMG